MPLLVHFQISAIGETDELKMVNDAFNEDIIVVAKDAFGLVSEEQNGQILTGELVKGTNVPQSLKYSRKDILYVEDAFYDCPNLKKL